MTYDEAVTEARRNAAPRVAFVLGGGGHLGAYEVGMLRALLEAEIRPDLVLGTSVGALNGAAIAARPDLAMIDELTRTWHNLAREPALAGSVLSRAANLVRTRTALHTNHRLRELVERTLPVHRFEDLAVPFQCVASSIERAAEHWFSTGALVDAVLASTAVPGLLPPVVIDGEHFLDGGLVNSIPIDRAVELGATEIYVLHVGRIEQPLAPPRNILQVAQVAFEIARRNRFSRNVLMLPEGVTAHVLPTGGRLSRERGRDAALRYRDAAAAEERIHRAHEATARSLSHRIERAERP